MARRIGFLLLASATLVSESARAVTFVDSVYALQADVEVYYQDGTGLDGTGVQSFDDSVGVSMFDSGSASSTAALAFETSQGLLTASASASASARRGTAIDPQADGRASVSLVFSLDSPTLFEAEGLISKDDRLESILEGDADYSPRVLLADALSQTIFEARLVFNPFGVFDNPFLVTGELLPGIYTLTVSTRTRVWTNEWVSPDLLVSSSAQVALALVPILPEPSTGLLLALGLLAAARRRTLH